MNDINELLLKADRLLFISVLPILAIGFILNMLVFYILTRARFLKESMFRYFIVTEILYSVVLLFWVAAVAKTFFSFLTWSASILCKTIEFLIGVLLMMYPLQSIAWWLLNIRIDLSSEKHWNFWNEREEFKSIIKSCLCRRQPIISRNTLNATAWS